MRVVRSLLITLGILTLALAIGAGVLLSPSGQEYLRARLAAWASRELGREVEIAQFRIEPGLHHLRVSATDLRLANAPWGSEPRMFSAGKLVVDVDAWSFFADTFVVNEISVDGLSLLLERTAEGEQNWDFDLPPSESGQSKFRVVVDRITMPGARLRFIGPRLERPLDIELATLEQSRDADDMLHLSVDGAANGTELALTGTLGPFAGLVEAKHFAIGLSGSLGEIELAAAFRVDDLARPVDTSATLRLQGPDAAYLAAKLGVRNLGDGPLDVTATLAPAADHKGIGGTVAGKIGAFVIDASAELDDPARMAKLALDARISGPDLSLLGGIAGIDTLPPEAFTLEAKMRREGQVLQIDEAALALSDTTLRIQGTVGRLDRLADATLRVQVHGEDIARLRKLLRIPGIATGAFDVSGAMKPGESGVELIDVQASTSAGRATVSGNVGAYPEFFGTRLKFSASGPDFGLIGRAAGMSDPPGGSFQASGEFQWTPAGAVLRGSALKIGDDRLTLDGTVGRRPRTDATNLRFGLAGKNLAAIARRFGLTDLPASAYQASGEWRRQKGRDRVDNVVVSAAGARLRLAGQLGFAATGSAPRDTQLTVSLEGSDLAPFSALVKGYALPPGPFSVAGDVTLGKDRLSLAGARFSIARATGEGSADIGLPAGTAPIRIGIKARGDDLGAFVPSVRAKRGAAQPFDVAGNVTWRPGRWSFDHVQLGNAQTHVTLDGDLDQAPDFSATSLHADAHLPNLARTGQLLGLTLPALPLDFAATLSGTASTLRADNVTGKLGDSDFAGNLALSQAGKPDLAISFTSQLLDLTPFAGAAPTSAAPGPSTRARPKDARLIPDWTLPLELLDEANVRASVQSRKTRLFGKTYDDLTLRATLANGQLSVDPIAFNGLGGKLTARIEIDRGKGQPTIRITGSGQDLLLSIVPGATGTADASRYQVQVDLTAYGRGTRELAATATGKMRFIGTGGRVPSSKLSSFTSDFLRQLVSTLNPLAKRQPYTELVCEAFLVKADGGVLRTDPALVVRTKELDIISQGSVDLRTEKIDFNFKTAPRSGIGISVAQLVNPYIKVSGTLAAPGLTIDPTGSLVTGGAAFATGGLSIVATTVWDRVFRQRDPCAAAVAEADKKR